MNLEEKRLWDILVNAEWADNVATPKADFRNIIWRNGQTPADNGQYKLMIFSKLYRELSKDGPLSQHELNLLVQMGFAFAVQLGIEKP